MAQCWEGSVIQPGEQTHCESVCGPASAPPDNVKQRVVEVLGSTL